MVSSEKPSPRTRTHRAAGGAAGVPKTGVLRKHRHSPEKVRRFERARPGELWQTYRAPFPTGQVIGQSAGPCERSGALSGASAKRSRAADGGKEMNEVPEKVERWTAGRRLALRDFISSPRNLVLTCQDHNTAQDECSAQEAARQDSGSLLILKVLPARRGRGERR